ncbi:MAG: hypothetical protein ACUVWP_00530 [bacterium]
MSVCDEIREEIEEVVVDFKELSLRLKGHLEECDVCKDYYRWLLLNREKVINKLSIKPSKYLWFSVRSQLYEMGLIKEEKRRTLYKVLLAICGLTSLSSLVLFILYSFLSNYIFNLHLLLDNLKTLIVGMKIIDKFLFILNIVERIFIPILLRSISQFLILISVAIAICFMIIMARQLRIRFGRIVGVLV